MMSILIPAKTIEDLASREAVGLDKQWLAEEKAWQEEVDRLIEHGYITTKNEPLKCTACESANLEDVVMDTLDGYTMSYNRKCKDCGEVLGSWDTGSWCW
jgi:hypothetical protein